MRRQSFYAHNGPGDVYGRGPRCDATTSYSRSWTSRFTNWRPKTKCVSCGEKHFYARPVNPRTLRTYYAKELQRGTFEMLLEVEEAHFKAAIEGNVTAQIHILACKGGWVNPNRVRKVTAPSSPPVKKSGMKGSCGWAMTVSATTGTEIERTILNAGNACRTNQHASALLAAK